MEIDHEQEFHVWPLRDEPLVAWPLLAVIAGIAVGAGWWLTSLSMGAGIFLALIVCTGEMWVSTVTRINHGGISQHSLLRRRRVGWRDVVECLPRPRGVLLHTRPHAVATPAGMFVRCGAHRKEMLDAVDECGLHSFVLSLPADDESDGESPTQPARLSPEEST
ncbi:MAG: hypothetical protein KDB14_22565 [Planctomycetales bacterium]|nr:hypothetical protein [Planctomycetales bacterium]